MQNQQVSHASKFVFHGSGSWHHIFYDNSKSLKSLACTLSSLDRLMIANLLEGRSSFISDSTSSCIKASKPKACS